MNLENYLSNVLIAILGMGVVFVFLGFLSMIMFLLTTLLTFKTAKTVNISFTGKKTGFHNQRSPNGEKEKNNELMPGWLIAAVAAYLSLERDEYPVKASLWRFRKDKRKDGWIIIHSIHRKRSGIF